MSSVVGNVATSGTVNASVATARSSRSRIHTRSPIDSSRRGVNAGGPGVACADALELHGLRLADLSEATHAALQGVLPAAASLHNPVDMLASAMPEHYAECLRILLADLQSAFKFQSQ